jgi:hypothetical protein
MINVSVVLAWPDKEVSVVMILKENSTVGLAINIAKEDPVFLDVDFEDYAVGIYGELCGLEHVLSDGDRIELYRPIKEDPKEQRRKRALEQEASSPTG